MKIEIDQSGRVEYTSQPTVIAFSNSENRSVIINSKDKKYLQQLFRKAGKSNIFVYKTFSVLIFYLIKDKLKSIRQIIIDEEYTGYDKLIKQFIVELAVKHNYQLEPDIIHFKQIGKKSRSHGISINAYRAKKADLKFTIRDFLDLTL